MALNAGDVVWNIGANLDNFKKAMKEASKQAGKMGKSLQENSKQIGVGFAAAGASITAVFAGVGIKALGVASSIDKASNKMVSSLGLSSKAADEMADAIRSIYGKNFGDSIEDVGDAITETFSIMQKQGITAADQIERITISAISLSDAFETDVSQSTSAAATLMDQFGISSDQAFDMIAAGFQKGLNRSGDFLDSIEEYSLQFSEGGASVDQFFNAIDSGLQGGMLGTDKAADLFKEFTVRILDGSKGVGEALQAVGIEAFSEAKNASEFLASIDSGQITMAEAFTSVQMAIGNTNGEAAMLQSGVALMGTQFEDLGIRGSLSIDLMSGAFDNVAGSMNDLQVQYNDIGSAMMGLGRQLLLALEPLGQGLTDALNEHMPQITSAFESLRVSGPALAESLVSGFDKILKKIVPVITEIIKFTTENPKLASTLFAVTAAIGGIMLVLAPLFVMLPGIVTAFGMVTTAAGIVGGAIAALGAPILLAIAAVVAIAAAVVYNWDMIKAWTVETFGMIGDVASRAWGYVKNAVSNAVGGVINSVSRMIGWIKDAIEWFKKLFFWQDKADSGGGGGQSKATGGLVKGYASGGQTRNPIVKVGERGSELAALPVGTRVLSHPDMMRAAAQGMGGGGGAAPVINNTFTINGAGETDPNKLMDKLKAPFSTWMRDELVSAMR